MKCKLKEQDYKKLKPTSSIIYCDPPYANTTKYSQSVEVQMFWDKMREWTKSGNVVFISEYNAPNDFIKISSSNKYTSIGGSGSQNIRSDNLYVHKSLQSHLNLKTR
jgi:DNA adenine methylase